MAAELTVELADLRGWGAQVGRSGDDCTELSSYVSSNVPDGDFGRILSLITGDYEAMAQTIQQALVTDGQRLDQTGDSLRAVGRHFAETDAQVAQDFGVGARITDDGRIRASVPTIRTLAYAGARVLVTAHLGRPKGAPEARYSLRPVAARLGELLGSEVAFAERFARFMGTARFLVYMTAFVVVWLLWNIVAPASLRFDPYAFIFLTLMLSLQASYAAPLILLAQNRQDDRDKVQMEQDRGRNERNLADTEFLTREVVALRIAMRDTATRDFVRSELRSLLDEMEERGLQVQRTEGHRAEGPDRT